MKHETDAYVRTVLGRIAGIDAKTLELLPTLRAGHSPEESLLDYLVQRGIVSRVAARAILLAYRQEYDELDLRQLLQTNQLRAEFERLAADAAAPESTALATSDAVGNGDAGTSSVTRKRMLFRLGERINKFLIKGLLGSGGAGQIFLATHGTLGILVALKVFDPSGPIPLDAFMRQFRTEAKLLARLNHANIVRVLDLEEHDPPFMVLEYVDGDSLQHTLRHANRLEPARAYSIAVQVARGLRAAYRMGVIHLDVKPSNVLSTLEGTYKLADFGISRVRQPLLIEAKAWDTPSPILQGTLLYMAPELFENAASFRADIYALGLVLYQMLGGGLPTEAATTHAIIERHRHGTPTPLHHFVPGISPAVSQLVLRMLDKIPERRPGSYDELLTELDTAFGLRLDAP
ncbi:serine/threonine-protein kinase [Tuwongella immobilis]|uniref:Protein kinase domain-containing protein n=1 Tax=Tuwongella immobilis TaxID=692036 RepID=A0A6C2YJI3_9BACT|nr:serine/threonine-protein kinase [Tuwongella immobilis]VIP01441.1 serine threonine protein kinase : Serine/threonine protein kinase OS=Isosphaera pallida (strain ATCC 43644 / DSM 9630 / IS1B) GN=Isop_2224 PE=4 SV=1: Pkinase [Tuwongella immobilis]VTR98415.1 serine threonine protein kinase : Serine/threonine protein kinase OS=Isosphaera pallida (strain ATCC 43644 / DSM 9630 / IS1B) GN=Isop_2224 PE=4 SV=1: Pkinase [Tuwongella immobilis]